MVLKSRYGVLLSWYFQDGIFIYSNTFTNIISQVQTNVEETHN